ncbi:hypothetical protein [Streptomyces pseudogriseolus]|uniref:hypothetical protein n=1 Tax=Streptomyces pseudogriseolus TaxID=36817 RepID=UPI003FA33B6A
MGPGHGPAHPRPAGAGGGPAAAGGEQPGRRARGPGPPGDASLRHWHRVNLGRFIAEEHYRLTLALVEAGCVAEARVLLAAADAVLGELSDNAAKGVRELAERAAARVGEAG